MRIVPATAEMVRELYGEDCPTTCHAWAGLDGPRVLLVWGYYRTGRARIAFCKLSDDAKRDRRGVVRCARDFFRHLRSLGDPVYAVCDRDLSTAPGFLSHFGFKPYDGEVWVWNP